MNEEIYMESTSFNDSAIFQKLNATSQINKKLAYGLRYSVDVKSEMIVEYSRLLAAKTPLTTVCINEFEKGQIALKYYKPDTPEHAMPKALPIVAISGASAPVGVVFIAPFATKLDDDQLSVNPPAKLAVLMATAAVAREFYPHPEKFSSNTSLIGWVTQAYANIMVQLLKADRNLEPGDEMNTALYIFARFVVSAPTMLAVPSDDLQHSYAKKVCMSPSAIMLESARALWNQLPHTNIIELLNAFLAQHPKLKGLNAPYIMMKWIHRFGDLSAMALDQFPYFFMMLYSAQMLTNLTKDNSVKNVTRTIPRMNQMESEIRRILVS